MKKKKGKKEEKKKENLLIINIPYPHAPSRKDKEGQFTRFLDVIKRLQINIPFSGGALVQQGGAMAPPIFFNFLKNYIYYFEIFKNFEIKIIDSIF